MDLASPTNLEHLYLHNNILTGSIPTDLESIPASRILHEVSLWGNDLTFTESSELGKRIDRAVLRVLYNATGGDDWTSEQDEENNWLPIQGDFDSATFTVQNLLSFSDWDGVSVNGDGRVSELELSDNNLDGEVGNELEAPSGLETLNLSSNASLGGTLPVGMTGLTDLETLNIKCTNIETPTSTAFDTWLASIDFTDGPCVEPKVVTIVADSTSAIYRGGSADFTLTRTGAVDGPLAVTVNLTQDQSYLANLSRSVIFLPDSATVALRIPASEFRQLASGTVPEKGTLTATVADSSDYNVGTANSAAVDIVIAATIGIKESSYTVSEEGGSPLTVTVVVRTGEGAPQPSGDISVGLGSFATGTATTPEDYQTRSEFLNFRSSDFTADGTVYEAEKSLEITIHDDVFDDSGETFEFRLEGAPGLHVKYWYNFVNSAGQRCGLTCAVTATITDTDTAAPIFTDGPSTMRDFNETIGDAAVGTAGNIGTAVGASDVNLDTLTYSLLGTDKDKFGIVATSGQIQTKVGEKYDHEAKSSYSVMVKVEDGNGESATIDVTLNVTDQDEAPLAPAAPSVLPISGSTTSLDVMWSAPGNTGRPSITGYSIQYREGSSGPWTSGGSNLSSTLRSTTISGLSAGTAYEVQVRATNDEGDGAWSQSGTGTTTALPMVTIVADSTSAIYRGGSADFTLTRTGAVDGPLAVTVNLTQDQSYLVNLSRSVIFLLDSATVALRIPASEFRQLASGTVPEKGTLTATVADSTDYNVGTANSAAVDIVIAATIGIKESSYTVSEEGGSPLTVTVVVRTGEGAPQPSGDISVGLGSFATGSATTPEDYQTRSEFLNFRSSDFTADGTVYEAEKSLEITIHDDVFIDSGETFELRLEGAPGLHVKYWYNFVNSAGQRCGLTCAVTATITDTDAQMCLTDQAALVALYNATDGANWGTPWNTNVNLTPDLGLSNTDWNGVETDSSCRVVKLSVGYRGLSGTIPTELESLTSLTELSLYGNQLSGGIPTELVSLTGLRRLQLYSNSLGGTIPTELGTMTSLTSLNIAANQLSGGIPTELGTMTSLTELNLYNNPLGGTIPTELGTMTSLTNLNISASELSGEIPEELGNLTALTNLNIADNELSGEIPTELGAMTGLVGLVLSENQLSGTIPAELASLTSLSQLYLHKNELSGEIPAELGSLTGLRQLWLYINQLGGTIPTELVALTSLQQLHLSTNQLSGEIPTELGSLPNLRSLNLSSNPLGGTIPTELEDLTELKTLALSTNQLSGEIPTELASLPKLDRLYLHENQLSGEIPTELGDLTNLYFLALGGNPLGGEIPTELASLSRLIGLWLHENELSGTIPTELASLTRLSRLYLSTNELSGEIPTELEALTSLQHLYLSDNELSGEIPTELEALTSLQRLYLSDNELSGEIPDGA